MKEQTNQTNQQTQSTQPNENPMSKYIEDVFKKVIKEAENIQPKNKEEFNPEDYVEKREVAKEIINTNNIDAKFYLYNIIGVFAVYGLTTFNQFFGLVASVIVLGLNIFQLFKKRKYSLYLKAKYNLDVKIFGMKK